MGKVADGCFAACRVEKFTWCQPVCQGGIASRTSLYLKAFRSNIRESGLEIDSTSRERDQLTLRAHPLVVIAHNLGTMNQHGQVLFNPLQVF